MGDKTTLPKISIVTPSYNQGKYLEKTILSVLEQGYPNLEYIIIDGGSTDESVEIIKKYADRLTYWVSEPDRGQSHAINKGFERATGEVFGWLNSDDWYHPGALQAVAEAFAANPEAGAVVGAGEMVDEEGQQVLYKEPFDVTIESLCGWFEQFFWQPSCLFSQRAWRQCGPLEESLHYAMDLDLWFKIARRWNFLKIDNLLSGSLKHRDAKTTAYEYLAVIDATIVIVKNGGDSRVRSGLGRYLKHLAEEIAIYKADISEKDRAILNITNELKRLSQELDTVSNKLNKSYSDMNSILNSKSWKITAPIRYLADIFK